MTATLTWPFRILRFLLWFAWEMTVNSAKVVRDALGPAARLTPGFIDYRTRCRTEFEVTLLSTLITLTPGTLTLGAHRPEPDGPWEIAVHGMYFPEPGVLRDAITDLEGRMLTAVRREGVGR